MKLKGEYMLREIAGESVAIPVGSTALDFNGLICINAVGDVIWRGLQADKTRDEILQDILDKFEVSRDEATVDLDEFLNRLKKCNLLED